MNTPKPKQLEQRRPKQREIMPPNYRARIDMRKFFPHLPRGTMRQIGDKRAEYEAKKILDAIHEEEREKGAHREEESEH